MSQESRRTMEKVQENTEYDTITMMNDHSRNKMTHHNHEWPQLTNSATRTRNNEVMRVLATIMGGSRRDTFRAPGMFFLILFLALLMITYRYYYTTNDIVDE